MDGVWGWVGGLMPGGPGSKSDWTENNGPRVQWPRLTWKGEGIPEMNLRGSRHELVPCSRTPVTQDPSEGCRLEPGAPVFLSKAPVTQDPSEGCRLEPMRLCS